MSSLDYLFDGVRERFPTLASLADGEHKRLRFDVEPSSLWFESLSKAINLEMAGGVPAEVYAPFFSFLDAALESCCDEVRDCIDSSFVENLFWQVQSATQIRAYWDQMPSSLKALYVAFHGQEP